MDVIGRALKSAKLAATSAALAAAATLALAAPAPAQTTYTVTNLSDSGSSGDGSLRGELAAANANPGPDTIVFASGLAGTITLSGNGLQIKDPVDIEGPGPAQITVAQSAENRVIHVNLPSPGAVTIAGLHIANGRATSGPGGNIYNDAEHPATSLTIVNSLITGGTASDYGGGIDGFGASLTLRSTTISGNHATSGGGAWVGGQDVAVRIEDSTFSGNTTTGFAGGLDVEMEVGKALITGSTFSANDAQTEGGGIAVSVSKANLTIANSTVFGNSSAKSGGGGLSLSSGGETILVQDSTISGNHSNGAGAQGGGIEAPPTHAVQLEDTIVAGNTASAGGTDLAGEVKSAFSLIGNTSGAALSESVAGSNVLGVDPQLGPLQDNGGPTATMALTAGSPAVNKGSGSPTTDQRGLPRPVAYPGIPNSAAAGANGADIGAFELQIPTPPSNRFSFGKIVLNKKKGTATVQIKLPGPGLVRLAGTKKVKKASKAAKRVGILKLVVRSRGKALRTLKRTGKTKVKAKFTFTPSGGTAASKTKTVKLVRTTARRR